MKRDDWRMIAPLLNLVVGGTFGAAVYFGQPADLNVDGHFTPAPTASAAQVQRFDCWTSTNPRPGVIPGGVLFTRGADVRHSASDSVTGHYLDNLGSRHLVAFCTR